MNNHNHHYRRRFHHHHHQTGFLHNVVYMFIIQKKSNYHQHIELLTDSKFMMQMSIQH